VCKEAWVSVQSQSVLVCSDISEGSHSPRRIPDLFVLWAFPGCVECGQKVWSEGSMCNVKAWP
jgi:hypothetical protein